MKVVIDRLNWLRGEGSAHSYLLRPADKKQCCLGFLGQALNIDIYGLTSPEKTGVTWPTGCINEYGLNSLVINNLMRVNDHTNYSDAEREEKIKELFSTIGIEVEFIN